MKIWNEMNKSFWFASCRRYNSISAISHKQGKFMVDNLIITTTESPLGEKKGSLRFQVLFYSLDGVIEK